MSYSLGVDLGTTFLAAAVARPTGVRMVTLGDRTMVAPAVVHVDDDGTVLTGSAAQRRATSRPDLLGREFRRHLDDPAPIMLGGRVHGVVDLLAVQLRDVVTRVTDIEGDPPARVVLTHPASWSSHRLDRFGEVARAAGLEAPQTVTEAVAAGSVALAGRLREGEIAAVYDLGGGAFEATVVRRRGDVLDVLGAAGVDGLGGAAFDEAILAHVDQATSGALTDLDGNDPQEAAALARLRQDCVLAKESLSRDTETVVPVFLPGWHFEVRLSRWAFEEMVRPAIAGSMEALSRAVRSAGLISSDLGAVLLMGGSSQVPLVTEMLSQEFGRPTVEGVHPKYPVALGAASAAPSVTAVRPARSTVVSATAGRADDPVAVPVGTPGGAPGNVAEKVAGNAAENGAGNPVLAAVHDDGEPVAMPNRFDPPTQMLVIPRHDSARPLPYLAGREEPERRRHLPLAALAAAVAVLVLALVYALAPGQASVPPAVPAVSPGPAATSTAAPPSTTAAPTSTSATRSSTRARSGRTTAARPTRRTGTGTGTGT